MKLSTYKYILFWSLSALLMVIGIAVMTGWFLQNSLLVQLRSDFAPMQFNTALCFALCSCLLIANIKAQELISAFCSALVVAISGLTLLEYSANINLGIDELFIDHYLQTKTSHPGRMAPNTALCFMLFGAYGFAASKKILSFLWLSLLATIPLGLAFVALVGYAIGFEETYGWGSYTRMGYWGFYLQM